MKSTSQINSKTHSPRSDSRPSDEPRNFPLTDHSYQSSVQTRSTGSVTTAKEARSPREMHSFRDISNEFFGNEATVNYVVEAAFFAWITCIAAWPVGVAIYQLTRWMI